MEIFTLTIILVCIVIFDLLEINNILGTLGENKKHDSKVEDER